MPSQQLRTALEVSPLGNAPYAHQYPHVAPGTKRMYKRLKRAPFEARNHARNGTEGAALRCAEMRKTMIDGTHLVGG